MAWNLLRAVERGFIDDNLLEADDVMRFKNARDGDHMMVPFQCDICHFQNLKGQMPDPDGIKSILITWAKILERKNKLSSIKKIYSGFAI